MRTVTSKDGTTIAFDQYGSGPALILIGGASQQRAGDTGMTELAQLLSTHFTVDHYDRRGRGDSSDTKPFALDREIEDIEALIDDVGGSASLFGMSSGGALALQATVKLGSKVKKLAIYEVPYNDDPAARQSFAAYQSNLSTAIAEGRNGDAVGLFLKQVGMPDEQIAGMRHAPFWPGFQAIAPTLAYDAAALGADSGIPYDAAAQVKVPTLVMTGTATYPFMHAAADTLVSTIPNAERGSLPDQTHQVDPKVLAPVLDAFLTKP